MSKNVMQKIGCLDIGGSLPELQLRKCKKGVTDGVVYSCPENSHLIWSATSVMIPDLNGIRCKSIAYSYVLYRCFVRV